MTNAPDILNRCSTWRLRVALATARRVGDFIIRHGAVRPAAIAAISALSASLFSHVPAAHAQSDPHRGLWVGQAVLQAVNEAPIPLDEENIPIAPNPNVPTPTADSAHLRLILHVNGAGQVSLLKDVAILNRSEGVGDPNLMGANGLPLAAESDLALVTNERLFGEFPPQPAVRIASVVYDFGDSRASAALDAVVDAVVESVAATVLAAGGDLNDAAVRVALRNEAAGLAEAQAEPIVRAADVAASFAAFMRDELTSAAVDAIAEGSNDGSAIRAAAIDLRDASFYSDSRPVNMIDAVLDAVAAAVTNERQAAHNAAASFADIDNEFQRFIAGRQFGQMIESAAAAAAGAAVVDGATETTIREEVEADRMVIDTRAAVLDVKVAQYDDSRPGDATESVLDAIIASAAAALPLVGTSEEAIQADAAQAGRDALIAMVLRYPLSPDAPSPDYDSFVHTNDFLTSPSVAALGAATDAISEKRNNGLFTLDSLRGAARVGAVNALRNAYAIAARAARTEIPMTGAFGPGSGDTRFQSDIGVEDPPLGDAGLSGTLSLPANHPTNPFRHRRHSDHSTGFDITRNIRLDFDGDPTNGLDRVGFDVDRITGVYREEVLGLHKPLGPDPANAPIGVKTEGTFELNRISLIDTLNAL